MTIYISNICLIIFFFFFKLSVALETITNLSDYDYPKNDKNDDLVIIPIIGINDIHGRLIPKEIKSLPNGLKILRNSGLTLFSSYVSVLNKEYDGNIIVLDAGDQYQGTLESNLFFGAPVISFFNYIKNRSIPIATAIGNHEFDFGYANMFRTFERGEYPYLAANIYNRTNGKIWEFPQTQRSTIFQIMNVSIGVIGLSTQESPYTSSLNLNELDFRDYIPIVIEESKKLRDKNVDIVLLVAHIGTLCTGDQQDLVKLMLRRIKTNQKTICNEADELYKLVSGLPIGLIDGVIGGHRHGIMHHWINGVPVMIGDYNARHFNVLYLTYDKKNKKILNNESLIEGPIPICEHLLKGEKTCFVENSKNLIKNYSFFHDDTEVVNFTFHGEIIKEDKNLLQLFEFYTIETEKHKKEIIANISQPMSLSNFKECELGNFVSDIALKHTNSEISIVNRGVIRIPWPAGPITNYDLFLTFPFDNYFVSFETTGDNIIEMIKTVQSGQKAFYFVGGTYLEVCENPKKVLKLTLSNGEEIQTNKIYRVVTTNFLFQGGDDFRNVDFKSMKINNFTNFPLIRDLVGLELKEKKIINIKENPIVNESKPRMKVIKKEECEWEKKIEF